VADVVEEAKRLIDQGAVEINLLAQDLCAYGRDLTPRACLVELLEALDRLGEGRGRPLWLRCLHAYPRGLTDSVIDVIAGARSIVPYLDLPLQHIADAMLRRMRRGVDEQTTRALVSKLRARVPNLTLRTTFIAGLPGETEAEHQSLLAFVREARFEHLGVFAYSQQEDTPAGAMAAQVPAAERQRRKREIMRLQRTISREQQAARVGQALDVLVAGRSEETDLLLVGRHAGQAPDIDGVTYITSGIASPGDVVRVQVAETSEVDLAGEMLAS
jgi:ribosomal protein S12 methylthiotransferase